MKKKLIWAANMTMAVIIVALCVIYNRSPSPHSEFYRTLDEISKAIQQYNASYKQMPDSLEALGNPELLADDIYELSYTHSSSNYVLSYRIPSSGRHPKDYTTVSSHYMTENTKHQNK
jgi:hypothetical protein